MKKKQPTSVEKFYDYLRDVLSASKSLTFAQVELIFLRSLKDYFAGKIDAEYLNVVAEELYYYLRSPYDFDTEFGGRELGKVLYYATELSYLLEHKNDDSKANKDYESQVAILKKYYEDHKHFLKP